MAKCARFRNCCATISASSCRASEWSCRFSPLTTATRNRTARLYFYDAMGAQFEVADYAATGSGSPAVRGILYYENNWGKKPLHEAEAKTKRSTVALRALDTAAEADTATGGVDRTRKNFPDHQRSSRATESRRCRTKQIAARFKKTVA